jgi:hypothetical protein
LTKQDTQDYELQADWEITPGFMDPRAVIRYQQVQSYIKRSENEEQDERHVSKKRELEQEYNEESEMKEQPQRHQKEVSVGTHERTLSFCRN